MNPPPARRMQFPANALICVVDDDDSIRRSLSRLFRSVHLPTETFSSAQSYLDRAAHSGPSCLVLDVCMPDLDGLDLQQTLADRREQIVFLTGYGDVPTCADAMKAGAVDFLAKPVDDEKLLRAVCRALSTSAELRKVAAERADARAKLSLMTPREFEVMQRVIGGALNKQIADSLGAAEKTVKIHRGRVMEKMGVTSVAELIRVAQAASVAPVSVRHEVGPHPAVHGRSPVSKGALGRWALKAGGKSDDARRLPVDGDIASENYIGMARERGIRRRIATDNPARSHLIEMQEARDLKAALDECAIVTVTDPEGQITFANDKFCAISKYPRNELLGRKHSIVKSGHHSKKFFREMWKTVTGGAVWHGDIKNRAKDGSSFWVATTIVPCLDELRRLRQFVAISVDVTQQKRVEAELAEKQKLQRLLVELSTRFLAVPSAQVDAAIEEAQRLIGEAFGLDRSALWQFGERGPRMVLTHFWQRPGLPEIPRWFSTERMLPWAQEIILRGEMIQFSGAGELPPEAAEDIGTFRKNGPKANVTFPLSVNGQIFGALAFTTVGKERVWLEDELVEMKLLAQIICNVIGRKRAEMREEQMRHELSHAMRVATLGELSAALAHELNQPLAAILSNTQAARRFIAEGALEPQELVTILDDIVRDDKRAGAVIHNLRAMVSKRRADPESCCLNELARDVIEMMHSEMIHSSTKVRAMLAPDLPSVHGVRVELQQVLVNLLMNAVHAMKDVPVESRVIDLETRSERGFAIVEVCDRGPGVPAERKSVIFDPFFSTKTSGLGMGLSICRRIVENHGGTIEARNLSEAGASFVFSLPINRTKV
jgi:PAS domain S-box-containing protein